MSATGTRAVTALRRAGIDHEIRAYAGPERHGTDRETRPSYGLEAAAALGIAPHLVYKTLVVVADGVLMLAVVPSDQTLDLKRFAAIVGAHRATMAEVGEAQRATGYLIGGISPIATARRLRTVVDATAIDLDRVHVSAGQRGLQVALRPTDLIQVTGAEFGRIAVGGREA